MCGDKNVSVTIYQRIIFGVFGFPKLNPSKEIASQPIRQPGATYQARGSTRKCSHRFDCALPHVETAMRRGELLDPRWERVDLAARVAYLPETKTVTAAKYPCHVAQSWLFSAYKRRLQRRNASSP